MSFLTSGAEQETPYWQRPIAIFLIIIVGAVMIFTVWASQTKKWTGGKMLEVRVQIIDTSTVQGVADAKVTVFDGPRLPIEEPVSGLKRDDFMPDRRAPTTSMHVTDANGLCKFLYLFPASGTDATIYHSGSVDTAGIWILVSAVDRQAILVPLDHQSPNRRDIHDDSPIVVTIALGQCEES